MEYSFEARVKLTLEHTQGDEKSRHMETNFNLEVCDNLKRDEYLDSKNLPTKAGSHSFTNVLIQGLVGNIHMADQKGFRDSADHLRYIIAELEKGFISIADMEAGTFNTKL
jgi:hypothetical protein